MKTLKQTALNLTALSVLATGWSVQAAPLFDSEFLEVDGLTQLDVTGNEDASGDYQSSLNLRANITLTANLSEHVRAVIGAELNQLLRENGVDSSSIDFDFEEFIKEAYIEIRSIEGQPVAFILGKHEIAFGQNYSAMSLNSEGGSSVLSGLTRENQVFGVTMKLDTNFFAFLDSVEVSAFENEAGDLDVGELDNVSVRVRRQLTDLISAQGSYMNRDNGKKPGTTTDADREHRTSLGLIYDDGSWTAYVEGIGMVDNKENPTADWAATAGLARNLDIGRVAVEYNYIEDSLYQIGVGFQTELTDGLTIGPQIDYVKKEIEDDGEVVIGARLEYRASSKKPARKTETTDAR